MTARRNILAMIVLARRQQGVDMPSMSRIFNRIFPALLTALLATLSPLSSAFPLTNGQAEFIPAQPGSADTVYLKISPTCAESALAGPGYQVSIANGKLRVNIYRAGGAPPPCALIAPPEPPLFIEIGRLPAGVYALDIIEWRPSSFEFLIIPIASNVPLTVTDHRAVKMAPAVRLNYADHWWDAANSGVGIFIWQDARDQLLAAWFTYGADGNAVWYTIQAGNWTTATRYEGKLVQTSRPPKPAAGGQLDAPGPTSVQFVGTAMLDFSGDDGARAGVFTYKLDSASAAQTRNIRRFGK